MDNSVKFKYTTSVSDSKNVLLAIENIAQIICNSIIKEFGSSIEFERHKKATYLNFSKKVA